METTAWRHSVSAGSSGSRPESYHEREVRQTNSRRPHYSAFDAHRNGTSSEAHPVRAIPSNLPANFHEYHWRSTFGNAANSVSSRTSTVAGSSYGIDSEVNLEDNENPLVSRHWEHTNLGSLVYSSKKNDSTALGTGGTRFTLMSYNILAPSLVEKHAELYTESDPVALEWENRLNTIFEEVEKYGSDIICLQEVEAVQFDITFDPRFASFGYRGVFKKKTGDKEDGCAIFYKISKFIQIDKLEIEFLQPHIPLLNRDNVGLLLKLETWNGAKRQKFIVGTTHLLFNPKRQEVKLAQAQLLLAELDRFAFCGYDKSGNTMYYPILMTGDFNCKPYTSVTKLFSDGSLQYLDEHGELIKLLKRKGFDSVLPSNVGITDQCQHYKIVLERYKKWKALRSNNFELDLRSQESLVNIFPYIEAQENEASLGSPPADDFISLLSPVTEGVEQAPSYTETADSQFFLKAAQKIAALNQTSSISSIGSPLPDDGGDTFTDDYHLYPLRKSSQLDRGVLDEISKCGLDCSFKSGRLSHNLLFQDIYSPKLDRKDKNDAVVTTNQTGWICVDYVYQSMTWNPNLNKRIEGGLKLIRRLGLLNRNQCKQIGSIPNHDHASDHFPLVAEFLLRQ